MSKVYLLIRVSTNDQKDSLFMQKTELTKWCNENLVAEDRRVWVIDEGISGGKELLTRPASKIINDAQSGDEIVTMYLSRAFRDSIDGQLSLRKWHKQNITFRVFDMNNGLPLNWMDGQHRLMFQLMLTMAEQKLFEVSKTTKNIVDSKKAQNKPFARAKYGMRNIFIIDEKGTRIGTGVEVNHEEVKILRIMNEMRIKDISYADIAEHLNSKELYTRKGTKWNHGNIPDMIANFKEMVEKGLVKE